MSVLASCIMPSFRGAEVVERAIRCFQSQTYGPRELVILRPESDFALGAAVIRANTTGCRMEWVPPGLSIGELRNIACRLARGSVIVTWDDDDVSHPERIARSVAALKTADVTGTSLVYAGDDRVKKRWLWDGLTHARETGGQLYGATLAYRRSAWERHNFDPQLTMGEDVEFCRLSLLSGLCFHDLRNPALHTATISNDNTCPKHPVGPEWKEVEWLASS